MGNIVVGLLAIAFGLWGLTAWWWSVVEFLRGITPLFLLLFGVVALAVGLGRVRPEQRPGADDFGA